MGPARLGDNPVLTAKQISLLRFIHDRISRDGVPPSFEEMKAALDLRSKSGIHRLITALEERGFIRRLPHRARALEVIRLPEVLGHLASAEDGAAPATPAANVTPLPLAQARAVREPQAGTAEVALMGRIAAGTPVEALAEETERLQVPETLLGRGGRHYALEVRGESMIGAGINEGDIVLIREQSTAENGDIVVAVVEGYEATLKRFRRRGDMIALEAANPDFETRVLPRGQVEVQGRLVGLIRSY